MFLLFGSGLLAIGVNRLRHGHWSPEWPTTPVVILSSTLRAGHPSGRRIQLPFSAVIKYENEVGGTRYVARRQSFSSVNSTAEAVRTVAKYQERTRVTVASIR